MLKYCQVKNILVKVCFKIMKNVERINADLSDFMHVLKLIVKFSCKNIEISKKFC